MPHFLDSHAAQGFQRCLQQFFAERKGILTIPWNIEQYQVKRFVQLGQCPKCYTSPQPVRFLYDKAPFRAHRTDCDHLFYVTLYLLHAGRIAIAYSCEIVNLFRSDRAHCGHCHSLPSFLFIKTGFETEFM